MEKLAHPEERHSKGKKEDVEEVGEKSGNNSVEKSKAASG